MITFNGRISEDYDLLAIPTSNPDSTPKLELGLIMFIFTLKSVEKDIVESNRSTIYDENLGL
jgi:hypothetical protein